VFAQDLESKLEREPAARVKARAKMRAGVRTKDRAREQEEKRESTLVKKRRGKDKERKREREEKNVREGQRARVCTFKNKGVTLAGNCVGIHDTCEGVHTNIRTNSNTNPYFY